MVPNAITDDRMFRAVAVGPWESLKVWVSNGLSESPGQISFRVSRKPQDEESQRNFGSRRCGLKRECFGTIEAQTFGLLVSSSVPNLESLEIFGSIAVPLYSTILKPPSLTEE